MSIRKEKPFPEITYHMGFCKEDVEKYWDMILNANFTNKDEKPIYVWSLFFFKQWERDEDIALNHGSIEAFPGGEMSSFMFLWNDVA